jgi:CheY-like chemotaxis protein
MPTVPEPAYAGAQGTLLQAGHAGWRPDVWVGATAGAGEAHGVALAPMTAGGPGPAAAPVGPPRVLVVDPNRPARTALVELLRLLGMRVVEAAELDGARQAIRDLHPTVAVLDWHLPDRRHTGMPAARQLLAADPSLRVIVYTAGHDPSLRGEVLDAGVVDYLPKGSFGKGDLIDAIHAAHADHVTVRRPG